MPFDLPPPPLPLSLHTRSPLPPPPTLMLTLHICSPFLHVPPSPYHSTSAHLSPFTPHSHPITPSQSDPFLKVKIGKTEINDKHNYIPSQTNPIFGKMFELPAVLPLDRTLTITVMDWDRGSAHDLIGETSIDLENRFLSHYRATCGLPESFSK